MSSWDSWSQSGGQGWSQGGWGSGGGGGYDTRGQAGGAAAWQGQPGAGAKGAARPPGPCGAGGGPSAGQQGQWGAAAAGAAGAPRQAGTWGGGGSAARPAALPEPGLLPLRLEAEPLVKEALGPSSRVIGADGQPALIFTDAGLVALALERPEHPAETARALQISEGDVPPLALVRGAAGGSALAWVWQGRPMRPAAVAEGARGAVRMSEAVAEAAVRTIQRYYAVQVLEPSTRGFLSILEKQFTRSDLYLFELLQNAVDDGALHVRFAPVPQGLAVSHDGRRFNALDVLGLSSVGLSTKGDGQKRTIGFMGIGFKAVYKRFARVLVHDCLWRFAFEEPPKGATSAGAYAWVLQPRWEGRQAQWDVAADSPTRGWCHFQLERPREGPKGVQQDLARMPESVPALLGRQALHRASKQGAEQVAAVLPQALGLKPTKADADALTTWWHRATREWGVLSKELACAAFGPLLAALRKLGPQASCEAVWAKGSEQVMRELEAALQRPEALEEWGWRYIDDRGAVQGPFRAGQMRSWLDQGKLPKSLRVRGRGMGDFRTLGEIFTRSAPFAPPGLPPASFRLEWGAIGRQICLAERTLLKDGVAEEIAVDLFEKAGAKTKRWLFLSVLHRPDEEARKAYEKHAKREQIGDEEVSLFMALDADGSPVAVPADGSGGRGAVHAVLPTELKTPVGANLQGPWLLSVDRMKLQDFADNAWNRALLQTLPRLLVLLVRWIAQSKAKSLAAAYSVLPDLEESGGTLKSNVLGQEISYDSLVLAVRNEPLVPVLKCPPGVSGAPPDVAFVRGQEAVWLPPPFVELLPPDFLVSWLGVPPLAATKIGLAVYSPVWYPLRQVDDKVLKARQWALGAAIRAQPKPLGAAVRLLAALAKWLALGQAAGAVGPAGGGPSAAGVVAAGAVGGAVGAGAKGAGKVGAQGAAQPSARLQEAAKREQWAAFLPDFGSWPVFFTAKEQAVALSQVCWPDESWSAMPEEVRAIFSDSMSGGPSSEALHPDLLPLTAASGGPRPAALGAVAQPRAWNAPAEEPPPKVDGASPEEVLLARKCLQHARRLAPKAAVGAGDALAKKVAQWVAAGKAHGLPKNTVDQIVAVSRWAMENNDSKCITHALSEGAGGALRLVPLEDLHLRSEDVAGLEALAGTGARIPSISAVYFGEKLQDAPQWDAFWQKCGAKAGLSFSAGLANPGASDTPWLPGGKLPAVRTSKKTVDLPYGLGQLSEKGHKVLDVALAPAWAGVMEKLCKAEPQAGEDWPQRASAFARLVAALAPDPCGGSFVAPAGAPAAGKKTEDLPAPAPLAAAGQKVLPQGVSPPAFRRLLFLPPGQPKEAAQCLGTAQWVRQLGKAKWVPGRTGEGAGAKRGWFRPCEVLLEPDAARPGLPLAELPPQVRKALCGKALAGLFAWGTVAPEPPVDQLEAIAKGKSQAQSDPLWRAVVNAHRLGGLKPEQQAKLKLLAKGPVFPAPASGLLDGAARVPLARCAARGREDPSAEGQEETKSLVDARWLVDVRAPDWPLSDVVEDIISLVAVPTKATALSATEFLKWCCDTEPESDGVGGVRDAFTQALSLVLQESKKVKGRTPAAELKRLLPWLKLFCREGPGMGKDRFPARWLPAWQPGADGVRPMLNDDPIKAAMLTPAQGFQLLGVLDHPESRFPSLARLEKRDAELLAALAVAKMSGSQLELRTNVVGAPRADAAASDRLMMVLKLLWRAAGLEFNFQGALRLNKCERITRQLALTGSSDNEVDAFAVWGDAEREGDTVLLIAGDPEDYAAEVEELLEAKFQVVFSACSQRPSKVLRLLSHLESKGTFDKFVNRDFPGFSDFDAAARRKREERAQAAERARLEAEGAERERRLAEENAEKLAAEQREKEDRDAERREEERRAAEAAAERQREEALKSMSELEKRKAEAVRKAEEAQRKLADEAAARERAEAERRVAAEEAAARGREAAEGAAAQEEAAAPAGPAAPAPAGPRQWVRAGAAAPEEEEEAAEGAAAGGAAAPKAKAVPSMATFPVGLLVPKGKPPPQAAAAAAEAAPEAAAEAPAEAPAESPAEAPPGAAPSGEAASAGAPAPAGAPATEGKPQVVLATEGKPQVILAADAQQDEGSDEEEGAEEVPDRYEILAQTRQAAEQAKKDRARKAAEDAKKAAEEAKEAKAKAAEEAKSKAKAEGADPADGEEDELQALVLRMRSLDPEGRRELLKTLTAETKALLMQRLAAGGGAATSEGKVPQAAAEGPKEAADGPKEAAEESKEAAEGPKEAAEEVGAEAEGGAEAPPAEAAAQEEAAASAPAAEAADADADAAPADAAAEAERMRVELERLRAENLKLKQVAGPFPAELPLEEEARGMGAVLRDFENSRGPEREEEKEEEEQWEDDDGLPATKGQIKRMKLEAKQVLKRPINEGFGFKMMQKMGWKEGEALGPDDRKGLKDPLWVEPPQGKCGIFSSTAGELRPKKVEYESEDQRFNLDEVPTFVRAGDGQAVAKRRRQQAPRVPPTAANVAPAVLNLLTRPGVMAPGGQGGGISALAELLGEALQGDAGERFLRLVDERLGPQVAPRIAHLKRARVSPWGSNQQDEMLNPLWQLTRHHVPDAKDDDDEEGGEP